MIYWKLQKMWIFSHNCYIMVGSIIILYVHSNCWHFNFSTTCESRSSFELLVRDTTTPWTSKFDYRQFVLTPKRPRRLGIQLANQFARKLTIIIYIKTIIMQSSLLYIVISIPQRDRRMSGGVKVYDVQSRRSVGQINSRNWRTPRTLIIEWRTTTVIP